MELALAILVAGPLGYRMQDSAKSLRIYLILAAVIFPIQSLVVGLFSDDLEPVYFAVNVAIVALGIGLNRLGVHLRERRRGAAEASAIA
jgi:hypothetical protein